MNFLQDSSPNCRVDFLNDATRLLYELTMIDGFEHVVRENEPLAPYTSIRLGGVAEYFAEPVSEDDLIALVKKCSDIGMPVRVLGDGTNLLIRDEGVPGLVIRLNAPAFCHLEIADNTMKVGGGVRLSHFVSASVRAGFSGPDQLVGIPGTIGGALHSNIGAGGFDIGTWATHAVAVTRRGERVVRDKNSLSFSYRSSSLNELAIIEAEFHFQREAPESLTKQMQKTWIVRAARQPPTGERALWVFRDQGGQSASSLIDRSGLTGARIGKVEVCSRNSNFFVAEEGATFADVQRLIELVKNQVEDKTGVELALSIDIW